MFNFIKRLFCRHEYKVIDAYLTDNKNPTFIEECIKCGKRKASSIL